MVCRLTEALIREADPKVVEEWKWRAVPVWSHDGESYKRNRNGDGGPIFNKHVIKHRFCPNCGIHPFGEGIDPKGHPTAAINIRRLEGIDLKASR